MKPRILRKANLIIILAKSPMERRQKKEASVLDVGGKPQRIIPGENPRHQVGTEDPIHLVPPDRIRTRVLQVESEERYHYAILTAL